MSPIETITAGWYNVFYALGIAVAAGTALWAGHRRGWNLGTWGFVVAAWVTGGVIGAMLPHLIAGPAVASKTCLGAIAGGAVALFAAAKWLELPLWLAFDNTALAIPFGGAVVRIGCFLAGCCHGTLTSLPFGVRYQRGTEVFANQVADGLIPTTATAALPIHPVQLYEVGLDLLVGAFLLRFAGRLKRPGSSTLAMVAGLGAVRFATELVRDSGERFGALSLAQWVVAPVLIGAAALLIARERQTAPRAIRLVARATLGRRAVLFGAAVLAALSASAVLSPLEASTLFLVLGACGVMLASRMRARSAAPIGMAVLALQAPAIMRDSTYPHTYTSLGGGANLGMYTITHIAEDCDGNETERWTRDHSYVVAGLEAAVRREFNPTRGVGLRIVGFAGSDQAEGASITRGTPAIPGAYSTMQGGVTLIGDVDWRYLGLSLGGTAGSMAPMTLADDRERDSRSMAYMPAVGMRIGELDGFTVELKVGDNAPSWSPAPVAQFGIGIGDSLGNRIRFGISDAGYYVAGRKVSTDGLEFAPFVAVGSSDALITSRFHGGIMIRKWYK